MVMEGITLAAEQLAISNKIRQQHTTTARKFQLAGSGRMLLAYVVNLSQNLRWCLFVYIVCVTLIFVTHPGEKERLVCFSYDRSL